MFALPGIVLKKKKKKKEEEGDQRYFHSWPVG
jgi:hypothetical protein